MRHAGHLLAEVHNALRDFIKPGISTLDIDRYGERLIRERGGVPNFLHYNGYPASICVSVNDEVVHGIPSKRRILKEGEPAVRDYLKFLSGGCSTDPVSLLKIAGVDMSTPEPVNAALELFGQLIGELEELAEG